MLINYALESIRVSGLYKRCQFFYPHPPALCMCNNAHYTSQLQFGLSAGMYASWSLIGRDQFENPTYFIAGLSDSRDLYTQPFTQASAESNTTVRMADVFMYLLCTQIHKYTHAHMHIHTYT